MQFQKGQSGNPAGRPPGSRNKTTMIAEQMMDGEIESIVRVVIDRAKAGDPAAMKLCLDRVLPRRSERTISFELPPLTGAPDAAGAIATIAAAIGSGELTPSEAASLMKVVDAYARTHERATFENRVQALSTQALSDRANSGATHQEDRHEPPQPITD
jgi:hypothetical protein